MSKLMLLQELFVFSLMLQKYLCLPGKAQAKYFTEPIQLFTAFRGKQNDNKKS